jgi:heme A synthase
VTAPATDSTSPTAGRARSPLYSALVGLASLGVLLQGVWAGLFLREHADYDSHWVAVHSLDGQVTTALALAATVIAFVQLRARRDLVLGSALFTVLLVVEVALGEAVSRSHALQVVHIPLAMALMGLAVWLPLRARSGG